MQVYLHSMCRAARRIEFPRSSFMLGRWAIPSSRAIMAVYHPGRALRPLARRITYSSKGAAWSRFLRVDDFAFGGKQRLFSSSLRASGSVEYPPAVSTTTNRRAHQLSERRRNLFREFRKAGRRGRAEAIVRAREAVSASHRLSLHGVSRPGEPYPTFPRSPPGTRGRDIRLIGQAACKSDDGARSRSIPPGRPQERPGPPA